MVTRKFQLKILGSFKRKEERPKENKCVLKENKKKENNKQKAKWQAGKQLIMLRTELWSNTTGNDLEKSHDHQDEVHLLFNYVVNNIQRFSCSCGGQWDIGSTCPTSSALDCSYSQSWLYRLVYECQHQQYLNLLKLLKESLHLADLRNDNWGSVLCSILLL